MHPPAARRFFVSLPAFPAFARPLLASAFFAALLPLSGCLFGGQDDDIPESGQSGIPGGEENGNPEGDVTPGLYRLDYTPHFGFFGVASADSFGVATTLYLGANGTFR